VQYHEQPEAGHWWDSGNDDGADCVDWAPMFDMFARRRRPAAGDVLNIDFTTVCPGNSADCHWAGIHMQQVQLEPSRIQLSAEPNRGRIVGVTHNVARLRIDAGKILQSRETIAIEVDGEVIETPWPAAGALWLSRVDRNWAVTAAPSRRLKGPHRYGMLKGAMRNRFMLVYGTGGTPEENTWMFAKARYDAEQWQYRANGSLDVFADSEFDIEQFRDRDIVLYGNSDINSAFKLVKDAPAQVAKGKAVIGGRTEQGNDLAMLFCYPRPDSEVASVCVIGGTGLAGMRLTDRLGYFISGAAFPDVMLYGPELLEKGTGGVRAAGYFGEDWSVSSGEIVWRDEKQ
jgi:hypothetical protein